MRSLLEVSFSILDRNLAFLKKVSRAKKILIPVKANAYGLGAVPVSAFLKDKVDYLGFAVVEEALEVKESSEFRKASAGPGGEPGFLLLGQSFGKDILSAVESDISITVSDEVFLREAVSAARKAGKKARVHLKFDTGMGRIGFPVYEKGLSGAYEFLEEAFRSRELDVEGIYTHFPDAEDDPEFTLQQVSVFTKIVREAKRLKPEVLAHCSNSAATLLNPDFHMDMVRPGIAFYGSLPVSDLKHPRLGKFSESISPSVRWKAPVTFLKEIPPGITLSYGRTYRSRQRELIATVSVGYHDGYARVMSGKAQVLCCGIRCDVVGRITMDQILVKIDPRIKSKIKPGEYVVLLGEDGGDTIRIEEMASWSGTCTHEVIARIGERVQRRYLR